MESPVEKAKCGISLCLTTNNSGHDLSLVTCWCRKVKASRIDLFITIQQDLSSRRIPYWRSQFVLVSIVSRTRPDALARLINQVLAAQIEYGV